MDPNAALGLARRLAAQITGGGLDAAERADLGEELAEVFSNLDEWLTKGGFAPAGWKPAALLLGHARERTWWGAWDSNPGRSLLRSGAHARATPRRRGTTRPWSGEGESNPHLELGSLEL